MNSNRRGRLIRACLRFYPILPLLIAMMAALPAWATISTSGNVAPMYPGGGTDPWNLAVELAVGKVANGSLTVSGGSDVTSAGGSVGSDPGAMGTVTVTGAGSTWVNSQGVLLGIFGTGKLDVLAGGRVENQSASLGHLDGIGQARVSGAGSQWLNAQDLVVGNSHTGELMIDGQGLVRSRAAWIGLNDNAEGSVVVDGQQSAWEITDSLSIGDVSDSGTATLSLTGAGSRVYIGAAAAAQGAFLPVDHTALVVSKLGGTAQLSIYDGNSVQNSGSAYVGVGVGESGSVVVDGATSTWSNSGGMFVGVTGIGTLSLANGGTASSGGPVSVGNSGTVTGNGTVVGALSNAGAVVPGQSVGSLAVNGNYSQSAAGELQLELSGTAAGEFDTLIVSAQASLAGTLKVELGTNGGNPFVPQLGNTFQFLTAGGGVVGKFTSADLPTLAAGKMWQVRYSATAATLVVKLAGDYNDNGVVDAADYSVWRNLLGATLDPRADGDTNGVVNVADYNIWKANFGAIAGAGSGGAALAASVPEPTAALLSMFALAILSAAIRPQQR
jgi:T5SS/PEP-CTERM-associated repeat protein